MDGLYQLRVLRPDLKEAQHRTVIASLVQAGIPEDCQFHNELGREAEKLYPSGPGVIFQSKHPHETRWLKMSYPDGQIPVALLRDMAAVGWTWDAGMRKLKGYDPLVPIPCAPAFGGRVEIYIMAKGTGLFGSWMKEESRQHLRRIKKVLAMHGFGKVPHHKLTLADLL